MAKTITRTALGFLLGLGHSISYRESESERNPSPSEIRVKSELIEQRINTDYIHIYIELIRLNSNNKFIYSVTAPK